MKKLTSLLKTTGLAAIGGLLLATGASAGDDPVKEQAAAPQASEITAAEQTPEQAANSVKQDAKKKKSHKKTGLEKKRPERASGSK